MANLNKLTIFCSLILVCNFYTNESSYAVEQAIETPRAAMYDVLGGVVANETSVANCPKYYPPEGKAFLVLDFFWTGKGWTKEDKKRIELTANKDLVVTDDKKSTLLLVGYIKRNFRFRATRPHHFILYKRTDFSIDTKKRFWFVFIVDKGATKVNLKWGSLSHKVVIGKEKQLLMPTDYLSIEVTGTNFEKELMRREKFRHSKDELDAGLKPREGRRFLKIDMTLTVKASNLPAPYYNDKKTRSFFGLNSFSLLDKTVHNSYVAYFESDRWVFGHKIISEHYIFPGTKKVSIVFDVPAGFESGSICYYGQPLKKLSIKGLDK